MKKILFLLSLSVILTSCSQDFVNNDDQSIEILKLNNQISELKLEKENFLLSSEKNLLEKEKILKEIKDESYFDNNQKCNTYNEQIKEYIPKYLKMMSLDNSHLK
jgi:hypothetical protein